MLFVPPRLQPRLRNRQCGYFVIDPYRSGDSYYSYVVQHAHFDDPTTWINSCPRGNTIGKTNSTYSTVASKFGGASCRQPSIDGAAVAITHVDYLFGTNDFTIEFWFQPDARTLTICFDMRPGIANAAAAALSTNTSGDLFYYVSGATRITGSGVITAGAWQAICICRVSSNTRMFINGSQVGSTWADTTNYNAAARIYLGSYTTTQRNAYWDELRITNGIGRYAGNYTVDTDAFPDS